jgi:hypothetical protein
MPYSEDEDEDELDNAVHPIQNGKEDDCDQTRNTRPSATRETSLKDLLLHKQTCCGIEDGWMTMVTIVGVIFMFVIIVTIVILLNNKNTLTDNRYDDNNSNPPSPTTTPTFGPTKMEKRI